MKKILFVLAFLGLLTAHGSMINYQVESPTRPFYYIVVGYSTKTAGAEYDMTKTDASYGRVGYSGTKFQLIKPDDDAIADGGTITSYSASLDWSNLGNYQSYTFYMELLSQSKEVVAYSEVVDWNTLDKATQNAQGYHAWTIVAMPVPEPTSGLLLLMGFAGLALKRRRA